MVTKEKFAAKIFRFLGFNFDIKTGKITFSYRLEFSGRDPLDFTEIIILPHTPVNVNQHMMNRFLEPLHLILGISYYKLYCPPEVEIPFKISRRQAGFWNTVYQKGLGEFLYRNKLDPKKLAKFPFSKVSFSPEYFNMPDRSILGIGGGKDSIVANELLKDYDCSCFLVETQSKDPISRRIIDESGRPKLLIQRFLDPKIFANHVSAYNGHIPISAVFAFIGLLVAAVYKYKYVIVANEASSNFGNLNYQGQVINHQWSKTAEFESLLQEYARDFITPDIKYFSVLRQFYEIRVVSLFARYKKYFGLFSSCNRNFRVFNKRSSSLWCGQCPKCAFVFMMLAAFLDKKEVVAVFKKNLFAQKSLIPLFRDLLGFGNLKPFDCVGTFEESQAALHLASKKFKDDIVVNKLLRLIKNPKSLIKQVFKTVVAPTVPTPFRLLGLENICILGFGKDGHSAEKYIKDSYSGLKIGILDQKLDKNYLTRQDDFDLAVKSPGISKTKVKIPYITSTNIFFSAIANFTIGVTGSKGKSTTASLIFHILKSAGFKVRLLGNIGNPMLDVLSNRIDPEEIFVLELSSFMLEDIEYSPNIAVLLNLFPEHMDYHKTVREYYLSKKRIFRFQKPQDLAIKFPFTESIPLSFGEIPLLGSHNRRNIKAAVKVARVIGISDKVIAKAIANFTPLPHRLEFIGSFKGISFYDDAISTTPESSIEAIKALKNIGTIFLGGQDRGYDFSKLEKTLKLYKIKNIVLFPDSGNRILSSPGNFNVFRTDKMEKAVNFAYKNTPKGKICLLSTASPSYSLWKNFEEKGDLFQKYVKKLA